MGLRHESGWGVTDRKSFLEPNSRLAGQEICRLHSAWHKKWHDVPSIHLVPRACVMFHVELKLINPNTHTHMFFRHSAGTPLISPTDTIFSRFTTFDTANSITAICVTVSGHFGRYSDQWVPYSRSEEKKKNLFYKTCALALGHAQYPSQSVPRKGGRVVNLNTQIQCRG